MPARRTGRPHGVPPEIVRHRAAGPSSAGLPSHPRQRRIAPGGPRRPACSRPVPCTEVADRQGRS